MALSVFEALKGKATPGGPGAAGRAVLRKLLLSGALLIGLARSALAQTTLAADAASSAIAGNPGAVNIVAGTGALGQLLGLDPESGLRLGGVLVSNGNYLISGGNAPGKPSFNNLLVADLDADLDKLAQIPGASFGTALLRFDGQPTNRQAGVLTGYNGLTGATARPDGTLRTLVAAISLLRPAGGANRKIAGCAIADPTAVSRRYA